MAAAVATLLLLFQLVLFCSSMSFARYVRVSASGPAAAHAIRKWLDLSVRCPLSRHNLRDPHGRKPLPSILRPQSKPPARPTDRPADLFIELYFITTEDRVSVSMSCSGVEEDCRGKEEREPWRAVWRLTRR